MEDCVCEGGVGGTVTYLGHVRPDGKTTSLPPDAVAARCRSRPDTLAWSTAPTGLTSVRRVASVKGGPTCLVPRSKTAGRGDEQDR